MQNSPTGSKIPQCYIKLDEITSEDAQISIHGPVYGPIFYINMAFTYLLGGEGMIGNFPGCRLPCENPDCSD